jgi:cytoskeletal protein CcmA (bactofilin family)
MKKQDGTTMQQPSDSKSTKKTVIEDGTAFKGTLSASGPIVARGHLDGEVSGPALEVTETGVVAGKVKVGELRSRGELAGRFEAEDVILAGTVRDDTLIVARTVEVTPATVLTLEDCELRIGEPIAKEAAVRAALAPEAPAAASASPPPRGS